MARGLCDTVRRDTSLTSACRRAREKLKMSAAWKFFKVSETDSKVCICNDCSASVMQEGAKMHSFNTTNLIVHLKNHQPECYLKFVTTNKDAGKKQVTGWRETHHLSPLQSLVKAKNYNHKGKRHHSETDGVYRSGQPVLFICWRCRIPQIFELRWAKRRDFCDVALS